MRSRPLVLLIDDSDDTREVYAFALRLEGFAVEAARDGHEGVMKALESLPDIIVTDLSMPVMDGWETIRQLRSDQRTCQIPIIVCSGYDGAEFLQPVDALLAKPCPLDVLVGEVRRLLRREAA